MGEERARRPLGLSFGTSVAGFSGLALVWLGGFGCIGAIHERLGGEFEPGGPALQLLLSITVIAFGLCFLFVSYGLDRGRPWSRHLILMGWMLLLASLAFSPFGPIMAYLMDAEGTDATLRQRIVLGVAGVTLLVTAYLYTKPSVVAYYNRRSSQGLQPD